MKEKIEKLISVIISSININDLNLLKIINFVINDIENLNSEELEEYNNIINKKYMLASMLSNFNEYDNSENDNIIHYKDIEYVTPSLNYNLSVEGITKKSYKISKLKYDESNDDFIGSITNDNNIKINIKRYGCTELNSYSIESDYIWEPCDEKGIILKLKNNNNE